MNKDAGGYSVEGDAAVCVEARQLLHVLTIVGIIGGCYVTAWLTALWFGTRKLQD